MGRLWSDLGSIKNDLSKKNFWGCFTLSINLNSFLSNVCFSSRQMFSRAVEVSWGSLFLTKLFFSSFYLFTLVASFLFYSLGERWQTLRNHKYAEWLYRFRETIHDWSNARLLHSIIWFKRFLPPVHGWSLSLNLIEYPCHKDCGFCMRYPENKMKAKIPLKFKTHFQTIRGKIGGEILREAGIKL